MELEIGRGSEKTERKKEGRKRLWLGERENLMEMEGFSCSVNQ